MKRREIRFDGKWALPIVAPAAVWALFHYCRILVGLPMTDHGRILLLILLLFCVYVGLAAVVIMLSDGKRMMIQFTLGWKE